MSELKDKNGFTEAEAIERYKKKNYPKPALTADIVIFARTDRGARVLLIRRGGHPFLGCWALPGGFAEQTETIEHTAQRELEEETGITGLSLTLIGLYSRPGRDPRGWTVSAAFGVCLPDGAIDAHAGDDAAAVGWFVVQRNPAGKACVVLPGAGSLAFDHAEIISDAADKLGV